MRLLILSDYWGELGGGEVVAAQLAHGLRPDFEIAVLTTDRRRDTIELRDGVKIYRVRSDYPVRFRPLVALANPLTLGSVRRVLADFRPDLVHAWNVHQHLSYVSLLLARRAGAPVVLTIQDAQPFCYTKYQCYIDRAAPCPERPNYQARPERCRSCRGHYWLFPPRNRAIRGFLAASVTERVAVSHALADALAQNGIGDSRVIHNGIPLDDFPPPSSAVEALRARYSLGDQVVVGGGRMGFFKGQQQLLAAFAAIAPKQPSARVVFAGRDDDWFGQSLKARAQELDIQDRVVFTGFLPRPDFLALLGAASLFANPSLAFDSFPTVNLETGAAERPLLGTCFGGTPEVVLDGVTGRLVNPWRLADLTEALLGMLADADGRREMGRRAARRIREKFSLLTMVESYASLFRALSA